MGTPPVRAVPAAHPPAGDLRAAGKDPALPAEYERVLRVWQDAAPGAGARARAALAVLSAGLLHSPRADAFRRSALTPTGSPFEAAFASASPGLRYSVDPAPPEVEAGERLGYVLALLPRLNARPPDAGVLGRLAPLQRLGPLRYGAQIGARHDGATDRYKLYVELPAQAEAAADAFGRELLGTEPVLNVPGRAARPVMAGIDLATGGVEMYYRIENLHPREIGTVLGRANLAARAPEVLSLLAESQPVPIRNELPGATWGFSYSRDGAGVTASIYTFARTLFGPDGRVRHAVLSMAHRHGWDLSSYERVSQPLEGSRAFRWHHGMFAVVVRGEAPLAAWVGLAPPPAAPG